MYRPSVPSRNHAVVDTLSQAPEAALLLACARIAPTDDNDRQVARILAEGVDWGRALALAEAHGLLGLLFRGARRAGPAALPRHVEVRLWTYHEQLKHKNRLMGDELRVLVSLLEANGIPVVPFKGPTLAAKLYADPSLREFGDLDLLIAPSNLARARQLLAQRGYLPLFPTTPAIDRAMLASPRHYHLALKHELMVELHWRTDAEFPLADLDEPSWWANRPRHAFEGTDLHDLHDQELALVLLLHGSKHLWEQINWVAEVAELLGRLGASEWEWVLAKAAALGARGRVAIGLLLASRCFSLALPSSAAGWVDGSQRAARLADEIVRRWFEAETVSSRSAIDRLLMNVYIHDSNRHRLRHVVDVVFRPGLAEWTRWRLPAWLHPLYFPLRGARLVVKYLSTIRRG